MGFEFIHMNGALYVLSVIKWLSERKKIQNPEIIRLKCEWRNTQYALNIILLSTKNMFKKKWDKEIIILNYTFIKGVLLQVYRELQ